MNKKLFEIGCKVKVIGNAFEGMFGTVTMVGPKQSVFIVSERHGYTGWFSPENLVVLPSRAEAF